MELDAGVAGCLDPGELAGMPLDEGFRVRVNFLDSDDGTGRVREAYGHDTYHRLAEVKAKYDPENVFRNNKNIQPGKL